MKPAVTILFLSASCVQIYGPETPAEVQVEKLSTAGRFNILPVPGALRGGAWAGGKVIASTHFDPSAVQAADTVVPAASSGAKEEEETQPEAPPPSPQEPGADAETDSTPDTSASAPPLSGKKKQSA